MALPASLPPVSESVSFSSVSPAAVAAFQKDGATCIRQAFTRAQMALLAEGTDQSMASPSSHGQFLKGEKGEGRFFNDYCKWKSIPAFKKIVYESPAAELAAKLMESKKAIFYHEHVLVKEPAALKATPWHHDQSYFPIDGHQLCSFWIPVDPVSMETTLQFVAGSHQWGWFVPRMFSDAVGYDEARKVEMPEGSRPLSSYRPVPDIEAQRDRLQFLSWSLEPGDIIAFHGRVLHAASGNSSPIPRRVVSLSSPMACVSSNHGRSQARRLHGLRRVSRDQVLRFYLKKKFPEIMFSGFISKTNSKLAEEQIQTWTKQ